MQRMSSYFNYEAFACLHKYKSKYTEHLGLKKKMNKMNKENKSVTDEQVFILLSSTQS